MRSIYAMSYPAAMGGVVTEGHAAYCRDNGHAGWTEGTDPANIRHVGICPRCGEPTATPAAEEEEHDMHDDDTPQGDDIPQVWDNGATITIEDAEGNAITFPRSEARDLGRTLLAMTEGDDE